MLGEAIKKPLYHRPFEPFRLEITNGEYVDVRHPEMTILTRFPVVVGHGDRTGVGDHVLEYSQIHIVKIVPANGRPRQSHRK